MLYYYKWKDYPDTIRSTGSYILFYRAGPTDNYTHVPGPVAQSSSESEYNATYTSGISLSHIRILNNELMNNYPGVVQ